MVSYQTLDLVLVIVIHTSNQPLVTFVSLLLHALHLSWYMKFVSIQYTRINCFGKNDWDIFQDLCVVYFELRAFSKLCIVFGALCG